MPDLRALRKLPVGRRFGSLGSIAQRFRIKCYFSRICSILDGATARFGNTFLESCATRASLCALQLRRVISTLCLCGIRTGTNSDSTFPNPTACVINTNFWDFVGSSVSLCPALSARPMCSYLVHGLAFQVRFASPGYRENPWIGAQGESGDLQPGCDLLSSHLQTSVAGPSAS